MASTTSIYRSLSLYAIFGVTFTGIMGVSIVTPTLAATARELRIPEGMAGLIIAAYTLPTALFGVVAGILADIYGRRIVLIPSLMVLAVSGVATLLVTSFPTLIALRVVQGIATGAIPILSVVLIADAFSGMDRARAIGVNASVFSFGTGLFPFLAGILGAFSWNYPYLLFLFALPVALAVWRYIKDPDVNRDVRVVQYLVDALAYAKAPRAVATFAAAFLTVFIIFGAILTYFGILLDRKFGASPFTIGIFLSALSFVTAIASPLTSRLGTRIPKRFVMAIGFLLFGVGVALVPLMGTLRLLAVPTVILGIAQAFNIPALQGLVAELAPIRYRGAMGSFFGVMLGLGQSTGPALLGVLFSYTSLTVVFYASALLALAAGIAGLLLTKSLT